MRCYAGLCLSNPVRDVTDLKQCLTDTWNGLSQTIVDNAVDEWAAKGPTRGRDPRLTCDNNTQSGTCLLLRGWLEGVASRLEASLVAV